MKKQEVTMRIAMAGLVAEVDKISFNEALQRVANVSYAKLRDLRVTAKYAHRYMEIWLRFAEVEERMIQDWDAHWD